jgi:predicted fused transcriptional regulator/phosphomethylpyrimidine kinase
MAWIPLPEEGKNMVRKEDREIVLGNLVSALHLIQKSREFTLVIPEIRVSLVYATPWATTQADVAGIEGRIAPVGGFPRAAGLPAFGASSHMAHTIFTLREFDAPVSAAMNIKCNREIIPILKEYAAENGWRFGMLDRNIAPPSAKWRDIEGNWRLKYVVEQAGGVPLIFTENEGMGREQLTILVGKDATEITIRALEIARRYKKLLKSVP